MNLNTTSLFLKQLMDTTLVSFKENELSSELDISLKDIEEIIEETVKH